LPNRKLKEDAIPTVFPVVQSSYNKKCILDTQDICEEEEPVFIGSHQSYLISVRREAGAEIDKFFRQVH
jgi:hypothetical protein